MGPVSPEKTSEPPPGLVSVTRIAYASTGWSTRVVVTSNGPICWVGCQSTKSNWAAIARTRLADCPGTSYAR